jgi:hypothetical protein
MRAAPPAFLPGLPLSPTCARAWTEGAPRALAAAAAPWARGAGAERQHVGLPRAAPARRAETPTAAIDSTTLLAVAVSVLGVGGGVGLLMFYERQGVATGERVNTQPCTECRGETLVTCTVCGGDGKNPLSRRPADGEAETEGNAPARAVASADSLPGRAPSDACSYCGGEGKVRCFNCAGSGIQPRFLDRLSPDDFMD